MMNSKLPLRAMAATALALFLSAPLAAQTFEVKTRTLKNGMKVLVQEDHTIPNVALYIFYRIGSRHQHPGTTGPSHLFEHMMFNGSKRIGPRGIRPGTAAPDGGNNTSNPT